MLLPTLTPGIHRQHQPLIAETLSVGSLMAAVFTLTLSAPQRSNESTSSGVRTPPPTVSGMKICSAVRVTTLTIV